MKERPHSSFLRLSIRPWSLLTAAGAAVCAATVFGFLGRFSWFLDLFSHFRVQYLLGLSILGILLLVGKHRRTALVFLVFSAINLGTVLPLYFGDTIQFSDDGHVCRAMLLNVNTRLGSPELVRAAIQHYNPDIVVLEEISSQWVSDLQWLTESYPHSSIEPREDNFGIGLFSKLPLAKSEIVYIGDAEVPSVIAKVDSGSGTFSVIATHPLPPGGASYSRWRNNQLHAIPDYIASDSPVILLGDLNVTPWNHHFRNLLKRSGLRDSSKGRGFQPTWPSAFPLLLIPIDHCLHTPDIFVVKKEIGPNVGSDHYPVIVDFVIETNTHKNGHTR